MDSSSLVFTPSIAGVWKFVDDRYVTSSNSGGLANNFFGNTGLGAEQRTGIVMIGWQYSGFDNESDSVTPVNLGILEQQPDGTLLLATASYVSDASTQGGGSVIVADFNGDGRDDVFLAAHNESPFLLEPSTVLLSNAQGGFDRLRLTDEVMAHDAELVYVNGQPVVITASFSEDYEAGRTSPTYLWNGSGFNFIEGEVRNASGTGGMSVAMADFDGDGDLELAIGGFDFGLGVPWDPSNKMKIAIYDTAGADIAGSGPRAILTPYFEARAEYANTPGFGGQLANTHTFRTWVDDFNHDGRPDIVAAQSLWDPSNNDWPSMLQMLQNQGNFQFEDVSDTLNADFDKGVNEIDYEMQMVDLDGSGILSYLSARQAPADGVGQDWFARNDRQGNFLLVNDGTGRMHVALHEEFVAMGEQVLAFAASLYDDYEVLFVDARQPTPKMHGYITESGKLNFVAEVNAFHMVGDTGYSNTSVLVNVPVEVDLRTDFTDDIVITDRNHSMRMRTFAGDDTIHDAGANTSASIDGGLGTDTAVYSMTRASYTLAATGGNWSVTRGGLADTLKNIERVEFSDTKLALDLDGNAGLVAKTLGAVFRREAVDIEAFVGIGLFYADRGLNAEALMELALTARFGGAASHAQVVDLLYFNLLGAHPSPDELAYYVGLLETQAFTQESLGVMASGTSFNIANIGLADLLASGLAFE